MKNKHPHLRGAMLMRSPVAGQGLCFHRALGFVLDEPTARLAVGTLRAATPDEVERIGPNASLEPFLHAWCEVRDDTVIAPTTFEAAGRRLVAFEREHYYEMNGIKTVHIMTRGNAKKMARRYGLDRHLLYHEPLEEGRSFAKTILDEMGVAYRFDGEAVLPAGGA